MERMVRTHCRWRGSVKNLSVPPEAWECPFLVTVWFPARGPSQVLPIPDRSAHQGPGPSVPPSLAKRWPRWWTRACEEPVLHRAAGSGVVFLGRRSVACSNNKLVAIKADAVFS